MAFGEGFTVDMSVCSNGEDETWFRYDTGTRSNTLYMEYDSIDGYYYGYIEDTVPANCKRIYLDDEGDDIVLKGKIGELGIHVRSSVTKIKDIICRDMYS